MTPTTLKNAMYVARQMIASGSLDMIQASAVAGHDVQESAIKPSIVGDKMLKNAAHGIGQWRGSRFDDLLSFAKEKGKEWTDLDLQIDFQLAEINGEVGTEKSHGNRLKKAKSLETAVKAAMGLFRPKGYTLASPEKGHGWANRLQNAKDILAALKQAVPATPVAIEAVPATPAPSGLPTPEITLAAIIPASVPMVRLGDTGEAVRSLQLSLARVGYKLTGTGFFGPATDTALRDYQRSRGLEIDGEAGPKTVAALVSGKASLPSSPDHSDKPLWLTYAYGTLGVTEKPGASDNPAILAWAKEEGGAIAKSYKHDSIPWCALVANHWLTKAGLVGTETLWALDFNSYKSPGKAGWPHVKLSGPAVGAFIPMKREGGGHIAVVVGRTKDGMLAAIGGNQADTVSVNSFPRSRPLSYCWPQGATLPTKIGYNYLPLVNSAGGTIKES